MSAHRRRGFTLTELAVVLALFGVVGSAIGVTLLRQQRFYRGATELLYAREGVRDAMEILSTDVRGMSTADTARLLADSAFELFANIGSSVVCQLAGAEIGLPGVVSPRGNTLTAFLAQPDTGDLALFFRDSLCPEAEFDILANRHVRPEREVLKDHADPALLWLAKGFLCGGDKVIVNQNISSIRDDEARPTLEVSRLADTVAAL